MLITKCVILLPKKIITFEKTYGGSGDDGGRSVQQTVDEGYIVVGTFGASDTSGFLYLIKTDKFGKLLWQKKFVDLGEMTGSCVGLTNDGGYIITGTIGCDLRLDCHICLIKTDAYGNLQWKGTYGGYFGNSVQQTCDGGYIISGSEGWGEESPCYLVKTDSLGNSQWEKSINLASTCDNSIQLTRDGGYIIAGDVYLIKTDSSGTIQWKNGHMEIVQSALQTFDGGYIATGGGEIMKTDTSGNLEWKRTLIEKIWNITYSIQETRDSGYVISGLKGNGKLDSTILIKTDEYGNLQWHETFGGYAGSSVQQTIDGGYIIVGGTEYFSKYYFDEGKSDVYLIKTDSIGNVTEKMRSKN